MDVSGGPEARDDTNRPFSGPPPFGHQRWRGRTVGRPVEGTAAAEGLISGRVPKARREHEGCSLREDGGS